MLLPETTSDAVAALREILVERAFGDAGDQVIVEERLSGPEISVLAFSDGDTVAVMPAAQDHKRAFDGDQGPNTGGMGAYAPSPLATESLLDDVRRTILQPSVDGMRAEGTPYVGVLFAGLMLTSRRPESARVQLSLWRSGNSGNPPSAGNVDLLDDRAGPAWSSA